MAPIASARSTSATIITLRRSNRSLTMPPSRRNSSVGSVHTSHTIDNAVGRFDSS